MIKSKGQKNVVSLLNELKNNLSDNKEEDFSKLIAIDLNISGNYFSDVVLNSISNLIDKYDCFHSLNLSNNRNLSGSGIVKFSEILENTL